MVRRYRRAAQIVARRGVGVSAPSIFPHLKFSAGSKAVVNLGSNHYRIIRPRIPFSQCLRSNLPRKDQPRGKTLTIWFLLRLAIWRRVSLTCTARKFPRPKMPSHRWRSKSRNDSEVTNKSSLPWSQWSNVRRRFRHGRSRKNLLSSLSHRRATRLSS